MNIPRFIVENEGSYLDKIELMMEEAINYACIHNIETITLLVPSIVAFNNSYLPHHFGAKVSRALCNGKSLGFSGIEGVRLNLIRQSATTCYQHYGLVLGIYLSGLGLSRFNSIKFAEGLIYLPSNQDDGKEWLSTWNPITLGANTWETKIDQLPKEVNDLLKKLSRMISVKKGFVRKMDRDIAKRIMLDIKDCSFDVTGENIRKWAIRNDWPAHHADSLEKIAKRNLGM